MGKKKQPDFDGMMARVALVDSMAVSSDNDDPGVPITVEVTLDDVIPCPFNPRKQKNAKYDEIKASILATGLDHPPNVTRKKPTDKYMIRDGGNTRLQILNELWEETRDPRFHRFTCRFHPWQGEEALLVKHVIENDLRADTLFIERAEAAVSLKGMIEKKSGQELSIREAAKQFKERGWPVDHSLLALLFYAHSILLPHLPKALWGGMGTTKTREIRRLQSAARKVAASLQYPEKQLDKHWIAALEQTDADFFDVNNLLSAFSTIWGSELGVFAHLVTGEIQMVMQGNPPSGQLGQQSNGNEPSLGALLANKRGTEATPDTHSEWLQQPSHNNPTVPTAPENVAGAPTPSAPADNTEDVSQGSMPTSVARHAEAEQPAATTTVPTLPDLTLPDLKLNEQSFYPWLADMHRKNYLLVREILQSCALSERFAEPSNFLNGYDIVVGQEQVTDMQLPVLLLLHYLTGSFDNVPIAEHYSGNPAYTPVIRRFFDDDKEEMSYARLLFNLMTLPDPAAVATVNLMWQLINNARAIRYAARQVFGTESVLRVRDDN